MHICSYTTVVTKIQFEWDEAKNASNQRKHGLSFEEASEVFLDPLHVAFADRVVDGDQRWLALGLTKLEGGTFLILAVAHTAREDLGEWRFRRDHPPHFSSKGYLEGEEIVWRRK